MAAPSTQAERPAIDPGQLSVSRLRALRGPNVWRLAPVIACRLHTGALEDVLSTDVPGFAERLLAALPGVGEHPCSLDRPGGFRERLLEGTGWPHIMEHVALELQAEVGVDARFGRVVRTDQDCVWMLVVEYAEEEVGLASVREALALVQACMREEEGPVDGAAAVARLNAVMQAVHLGPSTGAIVEEARRRGIPVRRLNQRSLVQLGLGKRLRRIESTMSDNTSIIAVELAQDKDLTKRVLGSIGLAVPAGGVASDLESAIALAEETGYPVILKPLNANQGRGISPRLAGEADLRAAWAKVQSFAPPFVVEKYAEGRDHRVVVVNGRVVAATERVPAHVVGDGRRSIRELIEEVNRDPRRGYGHSHVLTFIPMDHVTADFLAVTGRDFDTVPGRGERVILRPTANLSTGGTSIDRTDEIHPDNITACEMAAGVIGLDIAGLDILTPDISVPFHENGAVIIEVNASPGIRMHTNPVDGKPRNVPGAILDMLYPPGTPATIPIIAVTGTNGKTTTTRLIAHLFRNTGKVVGFTTTDGVYLQTRNVVTGDMTGPFSANVILSNPTVEVAVLETARGGILRAGLGFDECDVGIVLNVTPDHLGLGGVHTVEQLAEVKGVIPAVVKRRGHAVLNVDDPLVFAMRERTRGDVVFFSTRTDGTTHPALAEHLEDGGIAAVIEDDEYVIRRGKLCIPIAAVRDVPLTLGGAARFQHGNILSAIAAAYVQGMRYEEIRAGLMSFFPSPALTPGRLNLVPMGGGRVLVDYAHNVAALEGLMDVVLRIDATRRIGVLAAPGDRRDEDIRALGRIAARLDHVVLKEDIDLRGRQSGQIAALLREGLLEGGLPADRIEVVLQEQAAVARGLELMRERDLVVITAVDVPAVLEQVRPLRSSV